MSRPACFVLLALALAACQQPEPPVYDVETTRVYAKDEQAVFEELCQIVDEVIPLLVVDPDPNPG